MRWLKYSSAFPAEVAHLYISVYTHNAFLEKENPDEYENIVQLVTPEEVASKGYEMMIEAIYNVFYQPFKWQALKRDMEAAEVTDEGYNPSITAEALRATARLSDFTNYTGSPKKQL